LKQRLILLGIVDSENACIKMVLKKFVSPLSQAPFGGGDPCQKAASFISVLSATIGLLRASAYGAVDNHVFRGYNNNKFRGACGTG
jgi:hypothetical protein